MANEDLIASKPAPVLVQSLATMEIVHTEQNDTVSLRPTTSCFPYQCHSASSCYSQLFHRPSILVPLIVSFLHKTLSSLPFARPPFLSLSLPLPLKTKYVTKHLMVFSVAHVVGKWRSITVTLLRSAVGLPADSVADIKVNSSEWFSDVFLSRFTWYE